MGRQKGHTELYRGAEYPGRPGSEVKVELVCCRTRLVSRVMRAPPARGQDRQPWAMERSSCRPWEETLRVRTGERGRKRVVGGCSSGGIDLSRRQRAPGEIQGCQRPKDVIGYAKDKNVSMVDLKFMDFPRTLAALPPSRWPS